MSKTQCVNFCCWLETSSFGPVVVRFDECYHVAAIQPSVLSLPSRLSSPTYFLLNFPASNPHTAPPSNMTSRYRVECE